MQSGRDFVTVGEVLRYTDGLDVNASARQCSRIDAPETRMLASFCPLYIALTAIALFGSKPELVMGK
jgi:hypothetical protein